jgi:hypothetical protein
VSQLLDRIQDVRTRLTETRITAREAREDFATTRAMAETRIIEKVGGEKALGANAEARERALLPALRSDDDYIGCLAAVRELEATAERLEAELEGLRDERREREWAVRLRLVQALERRGALGDGANGTDPDDTSFDDVGDVEAEELVLRVCRGCGAEVAEASLYDGLCPSCINDREAEEAAQAAAELQPEDPRSWPDDQAERLAAATTAAVDAEAKARALAQGQEWLREPVGEGELGADPDALVDDEPF